MDSDCPVFLQARPFRKVTGHPSGFLLTPNLMTAFALGSVDALGAMSIGYGGQGQSLTYQTTASFQFGYGANRHLLLGFESQSSLGAGFDSSILHVFIDSLLAYERSFTNLADAQDFFDDNTIDLGMTSSGGHVNVQLVFDLTASQISSGFQFDYAFGASRETGQGTALASQPSRGQSSALACRVWCWQAAGCLRGGAGSGAPRLNLNPIFDSTQLALPTSHPQGHR